MSGATPYPLEKEYNKKTQITPEDIKKLRSWVNTQPHLPRELITDMELILAYHSCSRSAEVSKQVLDLNYTLKTLFTNFFKNRIVEPKILKTLSCYVLTLLDTRAHDGSAVIFARLLNYDPKNFIFADAIRACLMVVDLCQYEQGTWPGFSIIIDLDKVTLSHLVRVDVQSVQQLLYYLQEAMWVKITGLHFLNAPSFMDKVMMLIRPFMKKELMNVLDIHQIGSKTIEKYLPIDALPKEAGGNSRGFQETSDYWIEKIKNSDHFFAEENKKRVTESLRPGKPKTISDIFGSVEGSFKKLEID